MSNFDKLKQLKKPMNLEKEVRSIKKIILRPSSVYGHGLISTDDFEKLIQRVERLELQLNGSTPSTRYWYGTSCVPPSPDLV